MSEQTKGWALFIHVMPIDDWIEHEYSTDCICGPSEEPDEDNGGWLYVHEALDGRI